MGVLAERPQNGFQGHWIGSVCLWFLCVVISRSKRAGLLQYENENRIVVWYSGGHLEGSTLCMYLCWQSKRWSDAMMCEIETSSMVWWKAQVDWLYRERRHNMPNESYQLRTLFGVLPITYSNWPLISMDWNQMMIINHSLLTWCRWRQHG